MKCESASLCADPVECATKGYCIADVWKNAAARPIHWPCDPDGKSCGDCPEHAYCPRRMKERTPEEVAVTALVLTGV